MLAYTLALAARELGSAPPATGDDAPFAAALRAGTHDAELHAVARSLRAPVRERLAVVNPGYART